MQNSPVVSNQKIFMFVLFVCAAIVSSLFIFHLRNQPQSSAANADEAFIFPESRDIKPFKLMTANNQVFSQDTFRNHWTLVFFGFTHCAMICPTTLGMIGKTYANLQQQYPNLQVVMVSLDPERDTPEIVKHYAESYNPAFIGVTGKIDELRKLQSQMGIYSAKSETAADGTYQIQHTSSIMLVNPEGKWAGMFKFGLSPAEFERLFLENVKKS
jgi:protein SCO1/2